MRKRVLSLKGGSVQRLSVAWLCVVWLGCDDSASAPLTSIARIDSGAAGVSGAAVQTSAGGSAPGTSASAVAMMPAGAAEPTPQFPRPTGICEPCGEGCSDCGAGCMCRTGQDIAPWFAPFEALGEDGFMQSRAPFCPLRLGAGSMDVFSDARGVFVLTTGIDFGASFASATAADDAAAGADVVVRDLEFTDSNFAPAFTQLFQNDGAGWKLLMRVGDYLEGSALRSLPGGSFAFFDLGRHEVMFMGEPTPPAATCSVGVLADGAISCTATEPLVDVAAASGGLVALTGSGRVLQRDGASWHPQPVGLPFKASVLWADAAGLIALGRTGTVMTQATDGTWSVLDTGTLQHFTAVWGTSRQDLWAGTASGSVFHYDGRSFRELGRLGGETCDVGWPIQGIWGDGERVYFQTEAQLARWDGRAIESLANWSCLPVLERPRLSGLWGSGPKDVFFGVIDEITDAVTDCGPFHVMRYDGQVFHRM